VNQKQSQIMNTTKTYTGFIGRPGVVDARLLAGKSLVGPFGQRVELDQAVSEQAEGPGFFTYRIRTIQVPREASAASQRKAWAQLIASANPNRR
jgi:hypothetical protein